ncbi:hypothetical protein K443DRAFT_116716 [Laccaria amethystina LaAM-08-1]|uniref:F-box domain-containing protein n=1 Tax=Laccaria amethystina LaAM-08-1 TaxID=1095629 RepID=A0A0C9X1B1_9AGAR|nr:hypothetical protein K443DRAFT_116716 [Laccaria amethystina LaAM-08-1]
MPSFTDSPPEIVKEIIDALQDDLPTLKACSQTCQSLLPLCRQHIYRTISSPAVTVQLAIVHA